MDTTRNLMTGLVVLVAASFPPHGLGDEPGITFQRSGTGPVVYTAADLDRDFGIAAVEVKDHVVGETVVYRGVAMKDLLPAVYGPGWHGLDELLITCLDGYQPSLPVEELVRHDAYLVFERADGRPFSFEKKGAEVPLGPFYLVWKTAGHSVTGVWSYQMVGMEPISFAERFPRLAPPAGADAMVHRGFGQFRKHCVTCHKINGQGGDLSVELNYPVSVTEYWQPDYLERWLKDPASVRHGAKMSAFAPGAPDRDERLAQILAYLRAMAQNKIPPDAGK